MANFGSQTKSFDGSTAAPCEGPPRVHLPPARARVNLPFMSTNWNKAPPNQYHPMSVTPNSISLDQYYPPLGSSQPRVSIPTNPQMHARYPSNTSQSNPNNLEDHLRGMIISNSIQQTSAHSNHTNHISSKRPNQAQRRRQSGPAECFAPASATNAQYHEVDSQQVPNYQAHPLPTTAPHLRGILQPSDSRSRNAYPHSHPNNGASMQQQSYNRPPPQHRQLFNPALNVPKSSRDDQFQARSGVARPDAQMAYLDVIAQKEIEQAAITIEEFNEKQRLREVLEQACQTAVYDYEKGRHGPDFDMDSVQLECFGSLSTTFATKASDMDLVLLSPLSQPKASSPESELPRVVEKKLLDLGYGVRLLTKTRVPIIKFCEKPTPELVALLLAECAKFEKERDSPPEEQAPKAGRKSTKPKAEKEKDPDPTLPQNRPDTVAASPVSKKALNHTESSQPALPSPAASTGSNGKSASPANEGKQPGRNVDSREENGAIPMQTEGADPSLLSKSDPVRIRLYKLAIGEGWYTAAERRIINNYSQTFLRQDVSETVKNKARDHLKELPNVLGRYRAPPEHHLDFPKGGVGIQCDINFSNHLALHNSHMLKCYSLCDPRVRKMVIFVKAWSKKRKINTPYHGTLSSYGYVLMVLHYLVNIARPPVLPNLQRVPLAFEDELSASIVELEGHNVQFLRNESIIEDLLRHNKITTNTESLGALLRGFFHYYAQQDHRSPSGGFSWSMDTLSLRTIGGIIPKQAKGWTGAKTETVELKGPGPQQTKEIRQRYLFAIEDPFETEHNIARTVVHNGIVAIRDEFRRAHKLIEHAGVMPGKGQEDLFAEGEDKENLQRSLFGPKPKGYFDRPKAAAPRSYNAPANNTAPANKVAPANNIARANNVAPVK